MKRQATEWEKGFANERAEKELAYRTCKELSKLNNKTDKQKNNQGIAKGLKREFTEEGVPMAKRHLRRCSTSLVLSEMQPRISVRYHYMLAEWLNWKIVMTQDAGEHAEKIDHSSTAGGSLRWYRLWEKKIGSFFKNYTCNFYDLAFTPRTKRIRFTQKPVHKCLWQ